MAIIVAAGVAAVSLAAADGAASPEAAVEELFASLAEEDVVGVLEALPPGEREVIREPVVGVVSELQRLGVMSSFDLRDVPGFDLQVDDLQLSSTPLGNGVTLTPEG